MEEGTRPVVVDVADGYRQGGGDLLLQGRLVDIGGSESTTLETVGGKPALDPASTAKEGGFNDRYGGLQFGVGRVVFF